MPDVSFPGVPPVIVGTYLEGFGRAAVVPTSHPSGSLQNDPSVLSAVPGEPRAD